MSTPQTPRVGQVDDTEAFGHWRFRSDARLRVLRAHRQQAHCYALFLYIESLSKSAASGPARSTRVIDEMNKHSVSRAGIAAAYPRIAAHIRRTPVIEIDGADIGLERCQVVLKLELLQHSGSFKVRGAFVNLVTREIPSAGVVAASGGNHGAAVAYAAMRRGVPARIFVPSISSQAKVRRIRDYGADLVVGGERYADALAASQAWAAGAGAVEIHAFDQIETLLGQGSIGLELEEQTPSLETLLVPVGGGGLIGGMAAWYGEKIRIIGVEPELSPTLARALEAGRPVDTEAGGIAADSLAPRRVGERVFPIAQRYVDGVVLVTDAAIRQAQETLWTMLRVVAEPGGAAAFAALSSGRYRPRLGERIGVLLSGANTVAVDFTR